MQHAVHDEGFDSGRRDVANASQDVSAHGAVDGKNGDVHKGGAAGAHINDGDLIVHPTQPPSNIMYT
eukprot:8977293-Karenia_brevis.AAC.1